jgi:signal transduction histidine kinase
VSITAAAVPGTPEQATAATTPAPLLVATGVAAPPEKPLRHRRLVLRVFLMALVVAVVVVVAGGLAAKQLAESEAIRDAATRTDGIALDLARPALRDGILRGDPRDVQRLDARFRDLVLGREIARVKIWAADGTIVYSDEHRLIGSRFALGGEERETLEGNGTEAEISDLEKPENRYERGDGTLLEVYRAIRTPNGTPLLFETYYRYDEVLRSAEQIWVWFAAVISAGLLLFLLALLPLLTGLVRSVERAREEREMSLLKALDASDAERRRIAASVHDGPVQDLVGASYRLGAAAASVEGTELERTVSAAEEAVRGSVDGLRDMLIDLYPAALSEAGIGTALGDLVVGARSRGAIVLLRVDDGMRMPADAERLMFRIARETIANAVKHGGGTPVVVRVQQDGDAAVLSVQDDGQGFDAEATLRTPPVGHFGMRLLQDAVAESGVDARLTVESAPGSGTTWRLVVA